MSGNGSHEPTLFAVYSDDRLADSETIKLVYKEHAKKANELIVENYAAQLEGFKGRIAAERAHLQKRDTFTSSIDKFWVHAFKNGGLNHFVDKEVDEDALAYLKTVRVDYQEDPREFDIVFEFKSGNPYFSNTKVTKPYRLVKPDAGSSSQKWDLEGHQKYSLQWPVQTSAVKVDWTSADHDLTKKSPRVNPDEIEEFDLVSFGSFFNYFSEEADELDIGEQLVEIYNSALEVYAGIVPLQQEGEEEEDSDDQDGEIDIEESEDEGKAKKRQRTK